MHRYEIAVLKSLKKSGQSTLEKLLEESKLEKSEALWALENLSSSGAVEIKRSEAEEAELTPEGKKYAKGKMPEEELIQKVKEENVVVSSLSGKENQIGLQWSKKKNLVRIVNGTLELTKEGEKATSEGVEEGNLLRELEDSPSKYTSLAKTQSEAVSNLARRNLISIKRKSQIESIKITEKGRKEAENEPSVEQVDALNKNAIITRSWHGKEFKPYDVTLKVEREPIAIRHPVRQVMKKIAETYLSLGFKQISGPIIEPAFWVFDSLFVPQDHPAREMQDTFYLSNPQKLSIAKEESLGIIKQAHLESWGGEWKTEVAEQALLRTHTTNVSAREMGKIIRERSKNKEAYQFPIKLFSIGRVFRNENIDYKHLTDFYHTDGIIIGNNLTLANLFDTLISIYKAFGMKVRFKPAYFPFVEPGVEIYVYYERTKEWVEMGGAGIIRREITGLPRKNLTVLAWGLGVERLAMLSDPSIKSITELYNNGVGWLRERR